MEKLLLEGTKSITVDGIAKLKALEKLRYLNLVRVQMDDTLVDTLIGMENLREVYLYQSGLTEDAMARLGVARPKMFVKEAKPFWSSPVSFLSGKALQIMHSRPLQAWALAMFAPVVNDLQVELVPAFFGEVSLQVFLGLGDAFAVRQFPSLSQAVNMGVDRKSRVPEGLSHDNRCGFVSDSGSSSNLSKVEGTSPSCLLSKISDSP